MRNKVWMLFLFLSVLVSGQAFALGPYNKVFLQVDKAQDHIFIYVDGVEKMRWSTPDTAVTFDSAKPTRIGEKIDITHLLGGGDNKIRVVAGADTWDRISGGYAIRMWGDATLILDVKADQSQVGGTFPGITLDRSLTVNRANGPARRTLAINSLTPDAIYINNVFTGKTAPATFSLSPGEYRVGLGESTTSVNSTTKALTITGKFRQRDVTIAGSNVTLAATDIPLVSTPKKWKVAIIPYTNVHWNLTDAQADAGTNASRSNIGLMSTDDISVAKKVMELTSSNYLLPMSYGLMKWEITVLPSVTQKVYFTNRLRWSSSMINADLSKYDMVTHVMGDLTNILDANGNRVPVSPTTGGNGSRPDLYLPAAWVNSPGAATGQLTQRLSAAKPSAGALHESLHNMDNYRINDNNGVEQLHGAEEHGYTASDCGMTEWLCFYISYIRSQIGENTTTKRGVATTTKITGSAVSTYAGVFNLMRGGRTGEQLWSFHKPTKRLVNAGVGKCMAVAFSDTASGAQVLAEGCTTNANQKWSLRHVQNGAYHLVNPNSGMCASFFSSLFRQSACYASTTQRWVTEVVSGNEFRIRRADSPFTQCLSVDSNGNILSSTCNSSSTNQRWRFD